ncbi:MAG: ATP-dependent DNA helicase RecQ [Bacteroidota bacterium]
MFKKILQKFFGYQDFRKNQLAIIKSIAAGHNTIAILPTGGGKSLCYQLPAVMKEGMAIIVSPLIALMKSQVDFLHSRNIPAARLNSTLNKAETTAVKEAISKNYLKLIYIAPETLNKEETIEFLKKVKISFIAIDEAHCISDWGHDFRPEYRKLKYVIQQLGNVPVIALTATATAPVQQDIIKTLNISKANLFISSFDRPNLYYEVFSKKDNLKKLIQIIRKQKVPTGIIYCQSRKTVQNIANFLRDNNIKAVAYHAGLDKNLRIKNQDDFLNNKIDVIVATIAFGMGIDKPDVRFVIHYDIPKSLESYYQETGRAGRDGKPAYCALFYDEQDFRKFLKFSHNKPLAERRTIQLLLKEIRTYALLGICRRKQILHYLGEEYDKKCHNCDNCETPPKQFQGKNFILTLLKTIDIIGPKFEENYIVNILSGIEDTQNINNGHNQLPIFGEQKQFFHMWKPIVRQALLLGYLKNTMPEGPSVVITPMGRKFLDKPHDTLLFKEHQYSSAEEDQTLVEDPKIDEELLKILLCIRDEESQNRNIKPYLIFQERMLIYMAKYYPSTIKDLTVIQGVGLSKAEKFGKPFVHAIQTHVKKHNIDPIENVFIKTNTAKFENALLITRQIDNKRDLEEIAKMSNLSFRELISTLEGLCEKAIPFHLDYYINKILSKQDRDYLYNYFYNLEEDNIEQICNELGEDYTEEEIRLFRINFLSKVSL